MVRLLELRVGAAGLSLKFSLVEQAILHFSPDSAELVPPTDKGIYCFYFIFVSKIELQARPMLLHGEMAEVSIFVPFDISLLTLLSWLWRQVKVISFAFRSIQLRSWSGNGRGFGMISCS